MGCLSQAAPLRGFGALHGSRRRLFGRSRGRLVPRTPPLHPHQRLSRAPPVAAHPDAPRGLRRLHAPRKRGAGGRFAATLRGCGLRDADCGVAGAARSSHAPAPPCRDAQPSIAVGASTDDAPTGAPGRFPPEGGKAEQGGEAHRQAARLFPVARQRRKRRHRGGEARAPRQQVTRPRPHSRRLSRHRHNAPHSRGRPHVSRSTHRDASRLGCVDVFRPPLLFRDRQAEGHPSGRRRTAAASRRGTPSPSGGPPHYQNPQWRRTPRYARLSRRRDAPRLRSGAGGRFAATLRGCGLRDADCGVAGAARSSHAPAPPCRDAQPSIAVGASTDDAPTGAPGRFPPEGGKAEQGGEAHRQAARLFPVARQRRKRRHRGGEARAPRQQVTRPRPHSRRLSRHRHNAPHSRGRPHVSRSTHRDASRLGCVDVFRPPLLFRDRQAEGHPSGRRRTAAASRRGTPSPSGGPPHYQNPQWRRTPRYARLSRRRDAPRLRSGAGGRFAATLRGWASVPRTARQPEPPSPPHLTRGGRGARVKDDAPFRARLTARQTARAFGTPYLAHASVARLCAHPTGGTASGLAQHRAHSIAFAGTVTAAVPTLRQGGRLHTGGGEPLSPLRGSERPRPPHEVRRLSASPVAAHPALRAAVAPP